MKVDESARFDHGDMVLDNLAYVAGLLAERQDAIAKEAHLESLVGDDEPLGRGRRARFAPWVAIKVKDPDAAAQVAKDLGARDGIRSAYVEGGPTPPPVNPGDDPRSGDQGYLDAAPEGIGARWAWTRTDGSGVGFVDLEQGWTLNHEDLAAAGITIISGVSNAYTGHGTAVLGEVVAVDNARGGLGSAPEASARVVSQWRTSTSYSTAAAIVSATDAMSPGDVLLLEAQTTMSHWSGYLPVEVEDAVFDAIRDAVDAGIVVVEAGGNGGNDLDAYTDAAGRHILNRDDPDFRDSGAIMVGAGSSWAPHSRLGFSNHGSRIDCYGWGEGIDTTGDGWTGTSTTEYTSWFGGTSGASPIVAGAALLLQSWRRAATGTTMWPGTVRSWLSANFNTPSADPAVDRIGVMPNLQEIFAAIERTDRFRPFQDEYLEWGYILFGILDDAPGVIWVPGRGPVPVDPDWRTIGARHQRALAKELARELSQQGVLIGAEQLEKATSAALAAMVGELATRSEELALR
ncbi:S8 family peptidase [Agromyces albus]|uniref:S8 family peptidase n=1 Tax=Agromyces albus TaxID=205332 RepID=UPI0027D895B1|nr:S8 family peptidase [Agromyces albus]